MRHEVSLDTSDGRRSIIIDDDWCHSFSVAFPSDNIETVGLFVASWLTLLVDSPLTPTTKKPWKVFWHFARDIQQRGLKAVVVGFADLAHKLVSNHYLMGTSSSIGEWLPEFLDTPVFFEYSRYVATGDIELLRYLYTFLNFGKKLDFVDKAFEDSALRGWLDVEKRLGVLKLDPHDTDAMRYILGTMLPSFTWRDLRPKFGPGSVQERGIRGRIDKLRSLQFDPIIDRFLLHGHIGMYGCGADSGVDASKIIPDPWCWRPTGSRSSRIARLRFVPKNLKVARSICMEPNTLMYFQQAVMTRVLELIDGSVYRFFIDIRNQQRNRDLCLFGSYTGEIDTLDLSAASDSVSLDLVRAIFPASWKIPMLATRSHSAILPDGIHYPLLKFAPMGSALCFPTQCLIFATVVIYAACLQAYEKSVHRCTFLDWLHRGGLRSTLDSFQRSPGYFRGGLQPCAIYGDDICVDGSLTNTVKLILGRLGFTVNEDKSFVGGQAFRESCGTYSLNGHDITPLYFRVKGVRRKLSAEHVASHVSLINSCRQRSYVKTYRFLRQSLMTWECAPRFRNKASGINAIPYVSDPDSFGILVSEPKNSHVRRRVHTGYQRDEIRVLTISYDYAVDPGDLLPVVDAYEYMRWWAHRDGSNSADLNQSVSRRDTGGAGFRWRWIPAE